MNSEAELARVILVAISFFLAFLTADLPYYSCFILFCSLYGIGEPSSLYIAVLLRADIF